MEDDLQILFVYGSLRPALAQGESLRLVADLEQLGAASVPGDLYDLGDYPGMVAGSGRVWGDLLRVSNRERFDQLDDYEECRGNPPLFRRVRLTARRTDGSCCSAWAYLYAGSVASGLHLPDGDYAAHLKRGRARRP